MLFKCFVWGSAQEWIVFQSLVMELRANLLQIALDNRRHGHTYSANSASIERCLIAWFCSFRMWWSDWKLCESYSKIITYNLNACKEHRLQLLCFDGLPSSHDVIATWPSFFPWCKCQMRFQMSGNSYPVQSLNCHYAISPHHLHTSLSKWGANKTAFITKTSAYAVWKRPWSSSQPGRIHM